MTLEDLISQVAEITDDGIVVTDVRRFSDGGPTILWCNPALASRTGYRRGDLIGQSPSVFHGPETDAATIDRVMAQMRAGQASHETILDYTKDGQSFWSDWSLQPIRDDAGELVFWIGIQRDVTALVSLQQQIRNARRLADTAQKRLLAAIEALPDAFVIFDSDDRLVLCNQRYRETYSASSDVIKVGAKFSEIIKEGLKNGQYPSAKGREAEWFNERMAHHQNPSGPLEQVLPDDRYLQIHEVRTSLGDTVGFRSDVSVIRRQSHALQEYAEALKHAAYHDHLTNLPNRMLLLEEMRRLLSRPHDQSGNVCLMHVDLDRFKEVNDTLGHPIGDEVLRETGEIMRQKVRKNDLVARVGGDEFAILLDFGAQQDTAKRAQIVANEIIRLLGQPMQIGKDWCLIGASIGYSFASDSEWAVDQIIGNADLALYDAKRAGKGVAVRFKKSMRGRMEKRHQLIQELSQAVPNRQFIPFYQPKIDLMSGTLVGFEALVRWDHPSRGILSPDDFLDLCEETGRIKEIDHIVLSGALGGLAQMRRLGHRVDHIAINASSASLRFPDFAASIKKQLEAHSLEPGDIRVEVVEKIVFAAENDPALDSVANLEKSGIKVDLDDFGSGFASFGMLGKTVLTGLKIDGQQVNELDNPRTEKIVSAIVRMARDLGMEITAEGVEHPLQLAKLKGMGCQMVQGHLIAKPMPFDAALEWLDAYSCQQLGY